MSATKKLVSRQEVQAVLGVDEAFLLALEREEIVVCERAGHYATAMVERIRICQSLHRELGVNLPGIDVALRLLETIRAERRQFEDVLRWLRTQLQDRPEERE